MRVSVVEQLVRIKALEAMPNVSAPTRILRFMLKIIRAPYIESIVPVP
jgi:hypothetical protein